MRTLSKELEEDFAKQNLNGKEKKE